MKIQNAHSRVHRSRGRGAAARLDDWFGPSRTSVQRPEEYRRRQKSHTLSFAGPATHMCQPGGARGSRAGLPKQISFSHTLSVAVAFATLCRLRMWWWCVWCVLNQMTSGFTSSPAHLNYPQIKPKYQKCHFRVAIVVQKPIGIGIGIPSKPCGMAPSSAATCISQVLSQFTLAPDHLRVLPPLP